MVTSTQLAKTTSISGIICILLSGVIYSGLAIAGATGSGLDPDDFEGGSWNATFIEKTLENQFEFLPAEIFVSFLLVIGVLIIIHPVWVLKRLYALEPSSIASISFLALILGVLFNFMNFLQLLGSQLGGRLVFYTLPEGDAVGLKSLNVTLGVLASLGLLLNAVEVLLISFALCGFSYLSLYGDSPNEHRMSRAHGKFGFALAALNFALFIFFIVALALPGERGKPAPRAKLAMLGVLAFLGSVIGYILWPIWVIWTGVQLSKKQLPNKYGGENMGLTELRPREGTIGLE